MKRDQKGEGTYVRRVQGENQRFSQGLMAENETLRVLIASLEAERLQLRERADAVDAVLKQNDALRAQTQVLEGERSRLLEEVRRLADEGERRRREHAQVQEKLAAIQRETERFSAQYASVERQNSNLANLYVASYRLHETLDRKVVIDTILDIIANLVGSEEMALFELAPGASTLTLVAHVGIDADAYRSIAVGAGPIGRSVESGETLLVPREDPAAGDEEQELTACVPLRLEDRVVGAIAVFRLLPQKAGLEDIDRELFELLATHAATALYCTGLHAKMGAPVAR
jgi:hypothetical protein